MKYKIDGNEVEINISDPSFNKGYFAGCDHPAFVKGNTLKEAPDCSDINPYEVGTPQHLHFRAGFECAIL